MNFGATVRTGCMLLAAMLTLLLAGWQWQRGLLHRAQATAFANPYSPVWNLTACPRTTVPDLRRVRLQGIPIGAPLFLQNSLLADGRDGARVLQLFHLDDGSAILVDLGWLAEGARAAPRVRQLDAVGRWLPTPHRFTLSGAVVAAEGRVDALDMAALQRRVHGPLRAGVVVLEAAVAPLLPWPLAPEVDPLRNFGYSLQWLVMSAGLFFLALWPVRKRRQR